MKKIFNSEFIYFSYLSCNVRSLNFPFFIISVFYISSDRDFNFDQHARDKLHFHHLPDSRWSEYYYAAIFMASGGRPLEQLCSHDSRRDSTSISGKAPPAISRLWWLHIWHEYVTGMPSCLFARKDRMAFQWHILVTFLIYHAYPAIASHSCIIWHAYAGCLWRSTLHRICPGPRAAPGSCGRHQVRTCGCHSLLIPAFTPLMLLA